MSRKSDQVAQADEAPVADERQGMADKHLDNAMAHVEAARDVAPYRTTPSWEDLHAAIRAGLRYLMAHGPSDEPTPPPPPPEPPAPNPIASEDAQTSA